MRAMRLVALAVVSSCVKPEVDGTAASPIEASATLPTTDPGSPPIEGQADTPEAAPFDPWDFAAGAEATPLLVAYAGLGDVGAISNPYVFEWDDDPAFGSPDSGVATLGANF